MIKKDINSLFNEAFVCIKSLLIRKITTVINKILKISSFFAYSLTFEIFFTNISAISFHFNIPYNTSLIEDYFSRENTN